MTMTDPIADMLTRIRNANIAMHDDVRMPSSKQKEALAILHQEGYIQGYDVVDNPERPGRVLTIKMKYRPSGARDLRVAAHVEAGPARLLPGRQGPAGPRRPRCRCPLDQPGADDRPRGAQAQRRRRSPVRGVVSHVAHQVRAPSPCRPV